MNQRIFELAKQAGVNYYSLGNRFENFDEHKFAELIVQDVIRITDDTVVKWEPDDLIEKFKQHFGIEE